MTDDQLEAAFTEAQTKWLLANPHTAFNTNQQRYFFWEGGNFGVEATAAIYKDTYGETHVSDAMGMPDDVEGASV